MLAKTPSAWLELSRRRSFGGCLGYDPWVQPGRRSPDAVQVANSDNAQEEGAVYGKMEYSITGVEVHDSSTGDGGKVSVVRWHAINNRTADSFAAGSYITAYQNKQMLHAVLPPIYRKIPSLRKACAGRRMRRCVDFRTQ